VSVRFRLAVAPYGIIRREVDSRLPNSSLTSGQVYGDARLRDCLNPTTKTIVRPVLKAERSKTVVTPFPFAFAGLAHLGRDALQLAAEKDGEVTAP